MPRPSTVLALNAGSSSLKFGLYRVDDSRARILVSGEAQSLGEAASDFSVQNGEGKNVFAEHAGLSDHAEAASRILRYVAQGSWPKPQAIGHRIVHGGPHCRDHVLIDAQILGQLEQAAPLAPLHVPSALSVVRVSQALLPGLAQVACLDTAFHRTMPDVARVLPLPKMLRAEGIERYGFHGISCESIVRQIGANLPGRLVIAHLGNGASITAVKDGRSIDTSMGLTPAGGVVMGSRTGDIDPGVLFYLLRKKGLSSDEIETIVERKSGLLGISGISHDMRRLHEAAASNPDAALAIEIFCASVRKQIGAMAAVLNGIDLLVFTGGIGEHDALVRAKICDGLEHAGMIGPNAKTSGTIVMHSEENEQIAWHTRRIAQYPAVPPP